MSTDHKSVQQLAYELGEKRGRPEGSAEEDWYAAERQLGRSQSRAVDESVKESFPASDSPASGLPDEPPVNAEEKWAAADAVQQAEKKRRGTGKNSSRGKSSSRGKDLSADPN